MVSISWAGTFFRLKVMAGYELHLSGRPSERTFDLALYLCLSPAPPESLNHLEKFKMIIMRNVGINLSKMGCSQK